MNLDAIALGGCQTILWAFLHISDYLESVPLMLPAYAVDMAMFRTLFRMVVGRMKLYNRNLSMDKSTTTGYLDYVRYILIIGGTATMMYLFGTKLNWLLAVISVAPMYVAVFCLADVLTLPLYLLTPEHKTISVALKAIEQDDFDTALRALESYEKSGAGKLRGTQHMQPAEVDGGQSEFMRVQNDDHLEDGVRDIVVRCEQLIASIEDMIHDDSLDPQEMERLVHNTKDELKTYALMMSNKNVLPLDDKNTNP